MTERKEFDAKAESVDCIMSFIEGHLKGFAEKTAYDLKLSCEEILINIASYAYPEQDGWVAVLWENDSQKVKVTFEDRGIAFNPLEKENPNLDVPMAERQIGGLGIMMVRKLMDSVEYERRDGKNILTITKEY